MDTRYLSYSFSNVFRHTYVIDSVGVKGWLTLRCVQTEYGENCVIDGKRGAQTIIYKPEDAPKIKARHCKKDNIIIGFTRPKSILTPSNEIIIGFN